MPQMMPMNWMLYFMFLVFLLNILFSLNPSSIDKFSNKHKNLYFCSYPKLKW